LIYLFFDSIIYLNICLPKIQKVCSFLLSNALEIANFNQSSTQYNILVCQQNMKKLPLLLMLRIAIIGFGKMGKAIAAEAEVRGHNVIAGFDTSNPPTIEALQQADVAIEFTRPEAAVENLTLCIQAGVPVVCGTTGWLQQFQQVCGLVESTNTALLYASNFSIGVNVFMEINRRLANMMNQLPEYEPCLHEIHHIHKLDAPSGTAISLANDLIEAVDRKDAWSMESTLQVNNLAITHARQGEVPGTHIITWKSPIDTITISHEAHNRKGFALGAVIAAEWLYGKKGIYSMKDVLNLSA